MSHEKTRLETKYIYFDTNQLFEVIKDRKAKNGGSLLSWAAMSLTTNTKMTISYVNWQGLRVLAAQSRSKDATK